MSTNVLFFGQTIIVANLARKKVFFYPEISNDKYYGRVHMDVRLYEILEKNAVGKTNKDRQKIWVNCVLKIFCNRFDQLKNWVMTNYSPITVLLVRNS